MKKFFLALTIILLAIMNTGCITSSTRGFLRSTIETYSENEKEVLLPYLDDSRKISDEGVQYLQNKNFDDLYKLMAEQFRSQTTLNELQKSIEGLEKNFGKILNVEYRNQAVEYFDEKSPMLELDKAQSKIWYAVQTTTNNSESLFLIITTIRVKTDYSITTITYQNYGSNIPSWLEYPDAPVKKP